MRVVGNGKFAHTCRKDGLRRICAQPSSRRRTYLKRTYRTRIWARPTCPTRLCAERRCDRRTSRMQRSQAQVLGWFLIGTLQRVALLPKTWRWCVFDWVWTWVKTITTTSTIFDVVEFENRCCAHWLCADNSFSFDSPRVYLKTSSCGCFIRCNRC